MDETVIAIEKVLGKWLERAIRLARIFFPLRAFVFIGRTRSYVRQQISQISFSFFLFVSYSPVISEENSTPERLISEPDTRCAYYERQNLFVHRFSLLTVTVTHGETSSRCATFAASVRFQTPSAFAVPLSKRNTITAC